MEWETVSTLLFGDGGVWVFEHLSVCWWEFVCFNMCREREGFKGKEANGWLEAEPKALPNFLPTRSFSNDGSGSPVPPPRALPPPLRFNPFSPRLLSRPRPLSEAPLLLTAHPPQTHRSVCASCSQSQSRCRSCVCRYPWCRCRWSRSEWWRRRTLRRTPGRDKIQGLSLLRATVTLELYANISMLTSTYCQQ